MASRSVWVVVLSLGILAFATALAEAPDAA